MVDDHPRILRRESSSLRGLTSSGLSELGSAMEAVVEAGSLPGLVALVTCGDDLHVEVVGKMAYGGAPMARETLFRLASISKPITAAAAMILVEDGRLQLDGAVDELLPELAGRQVLRRLEGPVDDTVPARRSITVRDLLSFRMGMGAVMAAPDSYPIQAAQREAGLAPNATLPTVSPDEWMRRLGSLPLLHQPGEGWRYHTGSDVLGVLIARASGQSFGAFLQERIFAPLGMKDTGFSVPADQLHRLPPAYAAGSTATAPVEFDAGGAGSRWSTPPIFESGGGGLVSTVDDYLAFSRMMLGRGALGGVRVLSQASVAQMTADQLTPEQRVGTELLLGRSRSWGFGMAVTIRRGGDYGSPGRFGWDGGYGTSAYADPAEGLVGILLTQGLLDGPLAPPVFGEFWKHAYRARASAAPVEGA